MRCITQIGRIYDPYNAQSDTIQGQEILTVAACTCTVQSYSFCVFRVWLAGAIDKLITQAMPVFYRDT